MTFTKDEFLTAIGQEVVDDRSIEYAKKFSSSEGWVFKQREYEGWFKLKETKTVDAIVVGCVPGKGKYAGMVGSLVCSVFQGDQLVEIANVSGMTDEQRHEMIYNCPCDKVIEIKYQRVESRGRLRHPSFIRFRPDKPARECTMEQLR